MDLSKLQFITSSTTYRELALRSHEYLHYQQEPYPSEQQQMTEDMFFNLAVEYMVQVGVARPQAEQFCSNPDNLQSLALRVLSILEP